MGFAEAKAGKSFKKGKANTVRAAKGWRKLKRTKAVGSDP